MSFFYDCWDSLRGNVRNCLTTPLTKKKLLIFGGIFVTFVLFIIILVVCLNAGGSSSSSTQGSDVLNDGPLTLGLIDNRWLKDKYQNKINGNVASISADLGWDAAVKAKLGAMIWSVGASNCTVASQKDAVSQTLESIDAAKRLAGSLAHLKVAMGSQDIKQAKANGNVAMLISLDGGYTIDSRLGALRMFYELGVRIMTLTGNCGTPWANNTASTSLTDFGKAVIGELNRMGILLDLAGSSSSIVTAALATSKASVIFNGVGAQSLTNIPKNLDNSTLTGMKGKGHVVMISFKCDVIQSSNGNCTSDDVINHINLIKDLAGASSVGIAADFDDGNAKYPTDLKNVSGIANLFDKLYNKEWSLAELKGLAFNNLMTALENATKTANSTQLPDDALEAEAELKIFPTNPMTCYSDLDIRYPSTSPTAAPATTLPTKQPTTVPTTAATTPQPTKKAANVAGS